jgi:hypothetical protein
MSVFAPFWGVAGGRENPGFVRGNAPHRAGRVLWTSCRGVGVRKVLPVVSSDDGCRVLGAAVHPFPCAVPSLTPWGGGGGWRAAGPETLRAAGAPRMGFGGRIRCYG